MYTLDQVAHILGLSPVNLKECIVFVGDVARRQPANEGPRMRAVQIMPTEFHDRPEWRVPESELVKYLRAKRLVIYERKLRL